MKKRRPTQEDIAKEAGVSQALVSLVFTNAAAEVAESTRNRILEIADQLGYRANVSGTIKRNKVLAYIRPVVTRASDQEPWIYNVYDAFYDRIQKQLLEEAFAAGYNLIVRQYTEGKELTRWLSEWGVDGVFWHARDPKLPEWIVARFPVVQINRHDILNADAVSPNQEELILLAMDYLRGMGHSRIAYIPVRPVEDRLWRMRGRAYAEYVRHHKLPSFEGVYDASDEAREKLFEQILGGSKTAPTAVIAADFWALTLIKEARKRAIKLPEQLSLVGMDNTSGGDHSVPALTSVELRMDEVARCAIAMLIERIKNPSAPFRKLAVTPELVIRESVLPLRESQPSQAVAAT